MVSSSDDKDFILLRLSGDISTKSRRTRMNFVRRLRSNVVDALESAHTSFQIERSWTRLFVETSQREAVTVLARVFGVQSLSVARRRPWEHLDDLVRQGEELFASRVQGRRFAVRARRGSDRRRIPFRSSDVERELGTALLAHASKVDLDHPEVTARVELDGNLAYFFTEQVAAHGGLPIGTEGRALALISGGFDSAVASWLLLKRGVCLDYLFFNLGGASHEEGALKVMKVMADGWSYGYKPRFYAVDLRSLVQEIQTCTRPRNWQVLLKRLMFRGAHLLAQSTDSACLVTGEAVGQVSSQTLHNLAVISQVTTIPILRPLVGFNKDEIVELARQIGTFELSAKVPEYCALEARPTTQASSQEVERDEAKLLSSQLESLISQATRYDLRSLDPDAARRPARAPLPAP